MDEHTNGAAVQPRPLTSMDGFERYPSLSPDGNHPAFVWHKDEGDIVGDIYVMALCGGAPTQLTDTDQQDSAATAILN